MSKIIEYNQEARQKLADGAKKLSDAVSSTLGPFGRNVIIEKSNELPQSTKDGVTVAKSITLKDPIENIGAEVVKQAAIKAANTAGDGTTTTTLLAYAMINEGLSSVRSGANAVEIKKGIDAAVKEVVRALRENSKDISSEEQLKQVATISANNDESTGELIATAIEKVGREGVVAIEESKTGETSLEVVEGIQFDRGYKSPYFVTNNNTMQAVLDEPLILIYDGRITTASEILNVLQKVNSENKSLLIVAEEIEGEALATLIVNKMRGIVKACAVKAPDFGERKTLLLEDLAIITGGQVITAEDGLKLEQVTVDLLGRARRVVITKDNTTIVDGAGDKAQVAARVQEIRNELESTDSDWDREKLQERVAKLAGGVCVIKVGAHTEVELKEKKHRLEDAISATRAAVEEGIVVGGGAALVHAASALDKDLGLEGDKAVGVRLVRKACDEPLRWIAENAGHEGYVVVAKVRTMKANEGFNAGTEVYEDLVKVGVIDPVKVTRSALANAASIAAMFITTEALVFETPEEKKEESNGHGHSHGPGGHSH
jgi:chaperonin GroEL